VRKSGTAVVGSRLNTRDIATSPSRRLLAHPQVGRHLLDREVRQKLSSALLHAISDVPA
jgi:hypothetical protein